MMVWFCPPHAGYTGSVRRAGLNVLVALTLALAGESPTCNLNEGARRVVRAIEVSHTQLAKPSFDQKNIVGRPHS